MTDSYVFTALILDTFNIQQINVTDHHDGCRVDCNFLEDDMTIDIKRLETDLDYWNAVAPDGATHYAERGGVKGGVIFYRDVNQSRCMFSRGIGHGWAIGLGKPACRPLIPRPAPAWSGEGYPPAGVECEAWFASEEWVKGLIVAHDEIDGIKVAVFRYGENYVGFTSCCLRPLKTEKERLVEAAMKVGDLRARDGAKSVYGKLYDAGLLKMPGGEL